LGTEVLCSCAQISLLVEEIEADRTSPSDRPEIDLAPTFDYLAQTLVGPGNRVGVAGACRGS